MIDEMEEEYMKKKLMMTMVFILCIASMFLPWFKTQDHEVVSGLILFDNPIALACIVLAFIGIWDIGSHGEIIGRIGFIGIIAMEIYEFLTWHILRITGEFSLQLSIDLSNQEFYLALLWTCIAFIIYHCMHHRINLTL